jgi:cyclic beta-1,2-glucan synthetase
VLGAQAADVAHPAFSKMFVRTEFCARSRVVANRAARARRARDLGLASRVIEVRRRRPEVETDRRASSAAGASCARRSPCSRDAPVRHRGTVLDAVFALRYRVRSPAGGTARISPSGPASRRGARTCSRAPTSIAIRTRDTARTLAWTQAQVQLRHLGIDASQANLFQQLAGASCIADAAARAPRTSSAARRPAGALGAGHLRRLPIVLLRIEEPTSCRVVRQLLQAHEYWGIKRLSVDLVILNERGASYIQDLQVRSSPWCARAGRRASPARTRAARCSCCAAILITPETPRAAVAWRAVVLSRSRQPRRPGRAHAAHAAAAPRHAARAAHRHGRLPNRVRPRARVLQLASAASPRRAAST